MNRLSMHEQAVCTFGIIRRKAKYSGHLMAESQAHVLNT